MRNKTHIKITAINCGWSGKMRDRYMDETLLLRTAREVSDEETVNNTVLGRLREAQERGTIKIEIIK